MRQAFSKRKRGLALKCYQLHKLTDAKVCSMSLCTHCSMFTNGQTYSEDPTMFGICIPAGWQLHGHLGVNISS